MTSSAFEKDRDCKSGEITWIEPLVRRVIAPNAGPYTFTGTCTYIVGRGDVAIIDPGPNDAAHLSLILKAVSNEKVSTIIATHTHEDHIGGVAALQAKTGAIVAGCQPHENIKSPYKPDHILDDGESLTGEGWKLTAVATPGHTANHLSFALEETGVLFSGDHVMAWSTTLVAPPEGSMTAYMSSLARLQQRNDRIYWPGHGGPVQEPQRLLRALIHHRRQRETAIFAQLVNGTDTIPAIVDKLYENIDPALRHGAELSVLAHLEDLVMQGRASASNAPGEEGRFMPASG